MDTEKFAYFMERTEKDLDHIKEKVDSLWNFRSMVFGGAVVVSLICSGLVSLVTLYFRAN